MQLVGGWLKTCLSNCKSWVQVVNIQLLVTYQPSTTPLATIFLNLLYTQSPRMDCCKSLFNVCTAHALILSCCHQYTLYLDCDFISHRKCPEGYVLQKLEEKHTEFVASKWNYSPRGGKVSFFTNLIKLYHNVGLFPKLQSGEVCESPIGWCLQHYNGNLGHLFVCDEYRRKGLAKVLVQYMCTQILNDGQIPGCMVEKENISAMSFFESLGFVESDSRYGFICLYC